MTIVEERLGKLRLFWNLADPSTVALLASNLIVIVLAIIQNWGILTIMLIYWAQSVTIGFFTFLKILTMRIYEGSVPAIVNGKSVNLGFGIAKIFMAGFFAFHYGMFHAVYLFFIISFAFFQPTPLAATGEHGIDIPGEILSGAIFFINHLYSFIYNYRKDINHSSSIGEIANTFHAPYVRIIPMHLAIIFGFGFAMFFPASVFPLLLFMLLKTGADLAAHSNKHFTSYAQTRA